MRIIYVTTTFPYAKGEAFLIPEIAALRREGHEVLTVPRSPDGVIVHSDARPLLNATLTKPLFSREIVRKALAEVRRNPARSGWVFLLLLRSRNPVVAVKNLVVLAKGLWLAGIAREWGATHIHAHWAATVSTIAMIAGEVSGIPWSFTAHRFDIVENNLLAVKVRRAAFARFISRSGLELARLLGATGGNAKTIHMGVNVPSVPGESLARVSSPALILCPANLLPVKGHTYLIEALGILRRQGLDVSLSIAGEGELGAKLQRQVEDLGLNHAVRFLGQVSHDQLLTLYAQGKICVVVLPSVDLGCGEHEGIPVALIEAMSFGVPVVSTQTGGIPELLNDGAGLIVPPANSFALASALENLVTNADLRRRLAEAGRKRVMEEFSSDRVVAELLGEFRRGNADGTPHRASVLKPRTSRAAHEISVR